MNVLELARNVEEKISELSENQLEFVEKLFVESAEFDPNHYLDYIVEFAKKFDDTELEVVMEVVDGDVITSTLLENVKKFASNKEKAINEAKNALLNIDIEELNESEENEEIMEEIDVEEKEIPFISVVTSVLAEMLGEENVENLPYEMVFDIVEATANLDVDVDEEATLEEKVLAISSALKEALESGEIDFDTADYDCETFGELLEKFDSVEEMIESLESGEVLSESIEEDKLSVVTALLEGYYGHCKPHDKKCMIKKAKAAYQYFQKHAMHNGFDPHKQVKVGKDGRIILKNVNSKMKGKLKKYVKNAIKRLKKSVGSVDPLYIQYVLIPGIIKRMRKKGRHLNKKDNMTKQGMRAVK